MFIKLTRVPAYLGDQGSPVWINFALVNEVFQASYRPMAKADNIAIAQPEAFRTAVCSAPDDVTYVSETPAEIMRKLSQSAKNGGSL